MFAHRVVYQKHGCEGVAGCDLVLCTIEKQPAEMYALLQQVYGAQCLSRLTVKRWPLIPNKDLLISYFFGISLFDRGTRYTF